MSTKENYLEVTRERRRLSRNDKKLKTTENGVAQSNLNFEAMLADKPTYEQLEYRLIALFGQRNWTIFTSYISQPNVTLDTVGKQFNVSRERIRQIIKTIDLSLVKLDSLIALQAKVADLFLNASILTRLTFFNHMYQTTYYNKQDSQKLLYIINHVFKTNYYEYNGHMVNFNPATIGEIVVDTLCPKESTMYQISVGDTVQQLQTQSIKVDATTLNVLLRTVKNVMKDNETQTILIKDSKISNEDLCKYILSTFNEPVHYSEVHKKYEVLTGKHFTNPRNTLATLDRSSPIGVVRTFIGKYGLVDQGAKKHNPIVEIIYDVISQSPTPLAVQEVIKQVVKISGCKGSSVTTYLTTSDLFLNVDRSLYTINTSENRLNYPIRPKLDVPIEEYKNGLKHKNSITLLKPRIGKFKNKEFMINTWFDLSTATLNLLMQEFGTVKVKKKLLNLTDYKTARFFSTLAEATVAHNKQKGYKIVDIDTDLYLLVAANPRGVYHSTMKVAREFGYKPTAFQFYYE
jgi:hypothetical protein